MLKKDKIIQEKYNGFTPLCKCGCGTLLKYSHVLKDFPNYTHGHIARNKNHWGNLKSKKRVNAIKKTRKEKFASGEYDHIKKVFNAPTSQDTKDKISKANKGKGSFTLGHQTNTGSKHTQETKDKMSNTAIQNIIKTGKVKRSNLEYKFEGILELLEIEYIHSYYIEEIKKIYDFYLPKLNILIEVDGDFWHCNPIKYNKPECKTQEINLKNDEFKNQWAKDNNYTLLRFWENDINNNIQHVKQVLQENCKS
jgi:hypothetical protein